MRCHKTPHVLIAAESMSKNQSDRSVAHNVDVVTLLDRHIGLRKWPGKRLVMHTVIKMGGGYHR
ncbi:hypothetical protein ALQ60_100799 [Pseudomonas syringae pv. papulans]|nr:hypothetical protein ALQ60_100799 [Pseudomonas syringae pv. papulans]